jgi:hypothetical protein
MQGVSGGCGRLAQPSPIWKYSSIHASFLDGKIQAYVGPPELGAADDFEQVIVQSIAGAKTAWTSRSRRSTHANAD